MSPAERIIENKGLTAFTRISMVLVGPVLTIMMAIGGWYFSSQADAATQLTLRVVTNEHTLASYGQDLALLKQAGTSNLLRSDRDQTEIKAQLDRLQSNVIDLSNSVAALTAVLEAERRAKSQ